MNTPFRTPKACETCRRRKTKCDGCLPKCGYCASRNAECRYRVQTRVRKPTTRHHSLCDVRITTQHHDVSEVEVEETAARDHVYSSVSGTRVSSATVSTDHYYGPSSNFAFLEQIHRRFTHLLPAKQPQKNDGTPAKDGVDAFSYGRLFFGAPSDSDRAHLRNHSSPSVLSPTTEALVMKDERIKYCMEQFLLTSYCATPVWTQDEFRRALENFDTAHDLKKGIVLVVTALGCSITKDFDLAEFLFEEAKAISQRYDDIVNLQTVQLNVLLISILISRMIMGRVDSCYLICGTAARLAQAAGLHKESRTSTAGDHTRIQERRVTYWTLYALESLTCFGFGRPMSLGHNAQQPAPPEGHPFLLALIRISQIMQSLTLEIYEGTDRSLSQLWRSANRIRGEVMAFRNSLIGTFFHASVDTIDPGPEGVKQTILLNVMHHIIILAFRPFLLFYSVLNIRTRAAGGPSIDDSKLHLITEGCKTCVEAARKCIDIIHEACVSNPLAKSLSYHGFFLEGASFAIVYAILLRDTRFSLDPANIRALHLAVECLDVVSNAWPLKTTRGALCQMITLLERINLSNLNAQKSGSVQTVDSALLHPPTMILKTLQFPLPDIRENGPCQQGVQDIQKGDETFPRNPGSLQVADVLDPFTWPLGQPPGTPGTQQYLADWGNFNFDFGFDMEAIDFQSFFLGETPPESCNGAGVGIGESIAERGVDMEQNRG